MTTTQWHGASESATGTVTAVRLLLPVLMALAIALLLIRAMSGIAGRELTSDESLYLSEAVSIADGRVEYSSGDPIVHRPPLYPATLAPILRLSGNDVEVARVVPLAYAIGALAALYWLIALLFGRDVAAGAVLLAALAAAPAKLASGFFVDIPAAMWLMACAAALITARQRESVRWQAAAGALLGLSFLTKETAILWLPLPVAYGLVTQAQRPWRDAAVFYCLFAMLVVPWFGWVAWHTGGIFKVEGGLAALTLCGLAALTLAGRRVPRLRPPRTYVAATVIVAAWAVAMLWVLESRPEPHPFEYWSSVPDWTVHVFGTNTEPWLFIALAWVWLAIRGGGRQTMPLLFVGLGAPLYMYVANRGWEPRQVIWLTYLSYGILAWSVFDAAATASRRWRWDETSCVAAATVAIVALASIAGYASDLRAGSAEHGQATDWRSRDEQMIASWLRELPGGSSVLASRQYAGQLYVDTDGALPIRQLPTLGVTAPDEGGVRAFGTMFRYEDASTDLVTARSWIGLRPFRGRSYDVALAEEDLLTAIRDNDATHLLLTGDDGGFSSLSYRPYFEQNPAFSLVRADDEGDVRAYLYRIDTGALAARNAPLMLSLDDAAHLLQLPEAVEVAFWRTLAPRGVLLEGQHLDEKDMASLAK